MYNSNHVYSIKEGFTPLPLVYHLDDSSSAYAFKGALVTVHGGFVKGIQSGKDEERLMIRALSPLPSVLVEAKDAPANVWI